jgi:hypothetical protein
MERSPTWYEQVYDLLEEAAEARELASANFYTYAAFDLTRYADELQLEAELLKSQNLGSDSDDARSKETQSILKQARGVFLVESNSLAGCRK